MDSLKKIKLTAGLSATLLLGGGAAVRDVTVLDVAPIERVEIIAGERVEAKQIDNIVEATFPWKDQPGIKVKYDMGEPTAEEKIKDKRKKQVITETVTDFEGGFKVDILLSEKPETNRFCYTIEGAENYDFFYQPPLTAEEIAEGASSSPEIEGSYAVYHKTLKDHRVGRENYATGKVMHIPRPQVWSLNEEENKQWADLSYENGQLCVTASQVFLDNATYPVRIDPTFGYSTIGASTITRTQDDLFCYRAQAPENGNVTDVTFYSNSGNFTTNSVMGAIYSGDANPSLQSAQGAATSSSNPAGWATSTISTTFPNIVSGSFYNICTLHNAESGTGQGSIVMYRDIVSVGATVNTTVTYPTFPDPAGTATTTASYSIYATYTADAGEPTLTPYTTIKGDVQMSGDVYFSP